MVSRPMPREGEFGADPELLYDYMAMLDQVLVLPEISAALQEQGLTRGRVRNLCVATAGRLLPQAAPEYDRYRRALELRQERVRDTADRIFGAAALVFAVSGLTAILSGVLGQVLSWKFGFMLWWAGLGSLITAGASTALVAIRAEGRFDDQDDFGQLAHGPTNVRFLRAQLLSAISQDQLLAFIRTLLNEARNDRLGQQFSVTASPGLSEIYLSDYHVSTEAERDMDDLMGRLSGGSVGIAGNRGSGKSALIRNYCEPAGNRLSCMVAAPVDYAARDFVLHLFATFCRAVIAYLNDLPRRRPIWSTLRNLLPVMARMGAPAIAAILLTLQHIGVVRLVIGGHTIIPNPVIDYLAFAILAGWAWTTYTHLRWGFRIREPARPMGSSGGLRSEARRNLARVRYLQTRTTGWSGSLSIPGGLQGGRTGGSSWAEQPLSYPEIVQRFRGFAARTAEFAAGQGHQVFVGVDELDKIGTAEQAERFLNEIKGIFGVPHVYFLVSVSDEALTSFERRGLPLRDVFDSSFDEIIRVEPLTYENSRRLLYRRVVGLAEPYIALCHCLSGGLARDLIRAARLVVRIGQSLPEPVQLPDVCIRVVRDEIRRKAVALAKIVSSRASAGSQQDLLSVLHAMSNGATEAKPTLELVDLVGKTDVLASPEITLLRSDLAGYLYFCATLEAVFTDTLDEERMRWATSETDHPGHLDRLARARTVFAQDTRFAWRLIDEVRAAWGLPVYPL